jgi:hypothetical protein
MLSSIRRGAAMAAALGVLAIAAAATAQMPPAPLSPAPLPPQAAEIRDCLCLKAAIDVLGGDMAAKQQTLDGVRAQLAEVDAQMQAERARQDVNNPQWVAHFKRLLEQRDALFQRANAEASAALRDAVERYDARARDYTARCANRPMDAALLAQVQATLSCPPLP